MTRALSERERRGGVTHLYEAVLLRIDFFQAVLGEHLAHDLRRGVAYAEQQRLVGHVLAERLAVDLESAAGIGPAVLAAKLLQLALELLLAAATHHRLRIRDAAREARLRQFCNRE